MGEFEGWIKWLEPAFLLWKPGDTGYERPEYLNEKDEPKYSPEQELDMMHTQVNDSDGFDIDFSLFHCIFNYHSASLDSDDFVEEPETTGDLLKSLSQESLKDYNQEEKTEFEFVSVVKANFHCAAGIMFLITFEVKDPYDDLIKPFQTRVRTRHGKKYKLTEFVFCRPKPNQIVEYVGILKKDVEKVVKKQRLE